MSKTVTETEFKFFLTFQDAKDNSNYFIELVDVEDNTPPSQLESRTMTGNFRIKHFTRSNGKDNFIERIYLKI
jgi:hypothetical protein